MKTANELETKTTAIEPKKVDQEVTLGPSFVEAENMLNRFTDITRDIAQLAFAFFRERGFEMGKEFEDWFKAENEILRPTPVEITQSDENIFVKAAVPGFKPEEIEVSVKDDVLMISGLTKTGDETPEPDTVVREWASNRFYRQLTLPSEVIADKVTAKLNNGMLELTLPKAAAHEATKVAVASA